ncbi:hypothetical protein QBC99_004551 [Beijerinckia sp. GAS462]|nr:hypothetical protein [Beijerinckia sp. GAS462]SED22570.1 hypothetical protein SAMN05443249_4787 [Beijerinckia sp. 28-YEA-48]
MGFGHATPPGVEEFVESEARRRSLPDMGIEYPVNLRRPFERAQASSQTDTRAAHALVSLAASAHDLLAMGKLSHFSNAATLLLQVAAGFDDHTRRPAPERVQPLSA